MLFSSDSIPAMEQQQSFRKTSPALKHWWIKWEIPPRAGWFSSTSSRSTHSSQGTAMLLCADRNISIFYSWDLITQKEISMIGWKMEWNWDFSTPLRVFSLFLLFHIFHVALTGCFTLPVGHMQKSSLMLACHGHSQILPVVTKPRKALPYPVRGWKTSTHQGTALNSW